MSTNVGNLTVGLGYDLSALEKGGADAFRTINTQTQGMSAEMKRASREGAESFRLIDEALGIHLSRPLTRLLTQEFPGLAKGLQSILGVGVAGAIGVAGIEFVDKIAKKIEAAQKAQEALRAATENVNKVFAEEMSAYEKKDKAVAAATAAVDRLAESMQKQFEATAAASGLWNSFLANLGEGIHVLSSLQSTLGVEGIVKQLTDFKARFDELSRVDAVKGTHDGAKALAEEIARAKTNLDEMQRMKLSGFDEFLRNIGPFLNQPFLRLGVSEKEIAAAKSLLEDLGKLKQVQDTTEAGVRAQEAEAAFAKQTAAVKSFYQEIGSAQAKITPDADPLHKLGGEITAFRIKAVADLDEMRKAGVSALNMDHALAALGRVEKKFDEVFAAAKRDADVVAAAAALPTKIAPTGAAPPVGASSAIPVLGAGGIAGAQFDAFAKDQLAQDKLIAQAFQDAITPTAAFQLKVKELQLAFDTLTPEIKGSVQAQQAFAAAMDKLKEEAAKATDQLQKLLEKTDSASAGLQAFFLQLSNQGGKGGNGAFTFEILNKGLQGFEDETVKALTGGKTSWMQYFAELDRMALKFLLNKEIAQLFQAMAGTSLGKSFGLDKLMGGAAGSIAQAANTTALTVNTGALAALTAAVSANVGTSIGQMGAAAAGATSEFASGTDFAPGGLSLVGEQGPELVNLPTGASVMPNSALRSMGHNIQIHIDARGGEIGVEEKIARAISASAPQIILRAVNEASETHKRSLS